MLSLREILEISFEVFCGFIIEGLEDFSLWYFFVHTSTLIPTQHVRLNVFLYSHEVEK